MGEHKQSRCMGCDVCDRCEAGECLTQTTVYILWWKYSDGSAAELARAYTSRDRAEKDLSLAECGDSSKNWEIFELAITK